MFWAHDSTVKVVPVIESETTESYDIKVIMMYCFFIYMAIRILKSFGIGHGEGFKKFITRRGDGNYGGGCNNSELDAIVGLKGVKEELKYYMDFINNKEKYVDWEVKLPKGILLAGPPGTGKTLLVKTMANVLNIPIISVAGSSFVEKYVGVGAARVRDLFKDAKKHEKCIIFIDELDAVGSKRNTDQNSEQSSTLNQLLVEMDGFDDVANIMIFAATNLIRCLDPALLRSGRFDKKIYFDLPNFSERKEMFELYLTEIDLPRNLSHAVLSDRTAGMTGADIANITNQAKINAIQRGQKGVLLLEKDIQFAIDEVMIGREKRERTMSREERMRVSFHEAGHALMSYILRDVQPPVKVSIIPRGEVALGFSQSKPMNKRLHTRKYIISQICVLLGGRCAEKLIYGDVSTGSADDIEKISNYINLYNTVWGMSKELGALNPRFLGIISERLPDSIFTQCKIMVDELENFTLSILKKHKKHVLVLGGELLKNETIVYDEINALLPLRLKNSVTYKKHF